MIILNTKVLKSACSKILTAIDSTNVDNITDMLELVTDDGMLMLNITNRHYFVSIRLGQTDEDFHATVQAKLFLKLIQQTTTEDVQFKVNDTTLFIKGNGNYKLPLIYNESVIMELPKIKVLNPTVTFNIDSEILNSILIHNSKELSKATKGNKLAVNPLQKKYYMDNEGAITFYNGACVNKFMLEKPVKVLFDAKLVHLFSLFKDVSVNFTLGYDSDIAAGQNSAYKTSGDIIRTKVELKTADIVVTAILDCDDTQLKAMPAAAIRDRAYNDYKYTAVVNREGLLSAVQRLGLFAEENPYATIQFGPSSCSISVGSDENSEELQYANELNMSIPYDMSLSMVDLRLALEANNDQYATLSFGDHQAVVLVKDNIYTVIPEKVLTNG